MGSRAAGHRSIGRPDMAAGVISVKRTLSAAAIALVVALAPHLVRAENATTDETATIFATALQALGDGRPGDAIANFEALGDRGVVDPVVSFDRGLAYAARFRGRGAIPGDLGRAALGFEEARALGHDPTLIRDATKALGSVRAEVARRRALAGDPVDVDPGVSLGSAIVSLASEDASEGLALLAALVLTGSLFVRWLSAAHRVRIAAAIAMAISGPLLVIGASLVLAARDQRLHLREGVIVSASALLSDDRHLALSGAAPLPEAARVTIEETGGGWTRVRFGAQRGSVPSPSVRPIARPD
jgi:hypothetical protein